MDSTALNAFLETAFPLADPVTRGLVTEARPGLVRLRMAAGERQLRPGALVSGPTQMALADVAAYALVLAHVGPVAMAVTSSLTLNFLRGCPAGFLYADASLLRLGRRLVTVEVRLHAEAESRLVAQGSLVYALPDAEARPPPERS
jgi:uncharacterized protein (TIGR00369 family)